MIEKIHHYYPAFYNMLIATTLMSNQSDEKFDEDAKKVIQFIGAAYGMDDELIEYSKNIILNELVAISTDEDVAAFKNSHDLESKLDDLDSLFAMKCDAIKVAESLREVNNLNISPSWFEYSHYKPYYPEVRYRQLAIAATTGHPVANKVVSILTVLGIGCEKNIVSGMYRFKQCLMWSDLPSIYFLKKVAHDEGLDEEERVYKDLEKLIPYIHEGRTIIPSSYKEEIAKEAKELFAYISSIRQDVIINEGRSYIDYSFVEVILLKSLDYYKKLDFINNYRHQEWKEVTNSSFDPNKKLGFKVGK